eukprot:gb/GFBE01066298.1/.p1 GENE.gb/GFBE01066298.1/~~gb/GFBE01066298.1/.p1  ORF type:complete len:315 (+),score=71.14 gb/GFBE01066298.1/:1-945(+)
MAKYEESKGMFVKNTFIEVEDEEAAHGSHRRASSLPAGFRLQAQCPWDFWDDEPDEIAPSLAGKPADDVLSDTDLSTEAFAMSDGASSEAGQSQRGASAPSRTALKSSARAYRPGGEESGCQDQQVFQDHLSQEVSQAVSHLQSMLSACLNRLEVAAAADGSSFEMVLTPGSQAQNLEGLLSLAKRSLLQWAEKFSTATYVIGFGGKPFAATSDGMGFVATMGYLEDTETACWDSYKWGYCARGQCCRWSHPQKFMLLTVRIDTSLWHQQNWGNCCTQHMHGWESHYCAQPAYQENPYADRSCKWGDSNWALMQ